MTLIEKIQKLQSGELKSTPELIIEIENEIQLLLYKPYNHELEGPASTKSGVDNTNSLYDRGIDCFTGVTYITELSVVAEKLEVHSTKRELALLMAGAMRKNAKQQIMNKLEGLISDPEKLKKSFDDFMKSERSNSSNNS